MRKKTLEITAIEEGTVIDHIPSDMVFKVVDVLGLRDEKKLITIGVNLRSKKLGRKGLIKIANRFLTKEEVDRISIFAPHATINTIKGYGVIEKRRVEISDKLIGILRCINPRCVTNHEPVETMFYVVDRKKLAIRCHYCERIFEAKDAEVL